MIRQIPVEEKATILASLAYIIALAFYKHWLHSQYDVMNGSLIERAFATAGKPWYWFFPADRIRVHNPAGLHGSPSVQKGQVRAGKPCRLERQIL
ncbi:hypothetical protein [Bifidobacterium longum]|uniref:hypothetical protein n=1 Tax=Bifidobacterium longum TaxID=216816 RepID=UPI001D02C5BB|nr:hypothetical protein [Bifidobacterium longum]